MSALVQAIARHPVVAFMMIALGAGFLTAADKAKILGGNAARLLKIKIPAGSKAKRARGRR